ncbi:MAG: multidrug effflux MFS transporter [Myxococcales bacterium]|nr:multidrug effflux MFS transporter [Myxococcales bacterium]
MQSSFARNAVVLGLLTAIGPFAIDMYLPSLPSVAAGFGTDADAALASMTVFFITFALGQLVWGPSSDLFGRRRPLVVGLALFVIASVGCALAGSIEQLIGFRLLQGFGGAAGMVISRAIVRDLHSGIEETRLMSLLMLVFSVSPICAPLIGNGVIALTSWRGVFWAVGGIAVVGLLLIALFVPETRPRGSRADAKIGRVISACRRLLTDRGFIGLTLVSSFAFSGFLIYLANSPFVLSKHYGLSSIEYSIAFSVNAVAFFAAMQLNAWLAQRFGLAQLIRPAVLGYAATMAIALALTAIGLDHLALVSTLLFIGYGFLGIILPVSSVLALAEHGEIAGTASSLMSALQLTVGSVLIGVSGAFGDGSILRLVAAITATAVIAAIVQLALGRIRVNVTLRPGMLAGE